MSAPSKPTTPVWLNITTADGSAREQRPQATLEEIVQKAETLMGGHVVKVLVR